MFVGGGDVRGSVAALAVNVSVCSLKACSHSAMRSSVHTRALGALPEGSSTREATLISMRHCLMALFSADRRGADALLGGRADHAPDGQSETPRRTEPQMRWSSGPGLAGGAQVRAFPLSVEAFEGNEGETRSRVLAGLDHHPRGALAQRG